MRGKNLWVDMELVFKSFAFPGWSRHPRPSKSSCAKPRHGPNWNWKCYISLGTSDYLVCSVDCIHAVFSFLRKIVFTRDQHTGLTPLLIFS